MSTLTYPPPLLSYDVVQTFILAAICVIVLIIISSLVTDFYKFFFFGHHMKKPWVFAACSIFFGIKTALVLLAFTVIKEVWDSHLKELLVNANAYLRLHGKPITVDQPKPAEVQHEVFYDK